MADQTYLNMANASFADWLKRQPNLFDANNDQLVAQQRAVPAQGPMWNMLLGGGEQAANLASKQGTAYGLRAADAAALANLFSPRYMAGSPHPEGNIFSSIADQANLRTQQYQNEAKGSAALAGTGENALAASKDILNSPMVQEAASGYQQAIKPQIAAANMRLPNQLLDEAQNSISKTWSGMPDTFINSVKNDPAAVAAASQRILNGDQIMSNAINSGQTKTAIEAAKGGKNPDLRTATDFSTDAGAIRTAAKKVVTDLAANGGAQQAVVNFKQNDEMLRHLGVNIAGLAGHVENDETGMPTMLSNVTPNILMSLFGDDKSSKALVSSGITAPLVAQSIKAASPTTPAPIGDSGATITVDDKGRYSMNIGNAIQQSIANRKQFVTDTTFSKTIDQYQDQLYPLIAKHAGADKSPLAITSDTYPNAVNKLKNVIHDQLKSQTVIVPQVDKNGKFNNTYSRVPFEEAPLSSQVQKADEIMQDPDYYKNLIKGMGLDGSTK